MAKTKNNEVYIRRMTRNDIDSILTLGQWLITYRDMAATDPGGPLDLSFVAETNDHIVGCIIARIEYLGIPSTQVCVIDSMIVEEEYRRQGVGEALVKELFSRCRTEGVKTVRALVEADNAELIGFAEHLGFNPSNVLNFDKTLD